MNSVVQPGTDSDRSDPPIVPIKGGGLIEKGVDGWTITVAEWSRALPPDAGIEQIIEAFVALRQNDPNLACRCVLALPAAECFFAVLPLSETFDAKDATAIMYQLERVVPIDAESMVIDRWTRRESRQLFAVATAAGRHRALVEAIESAGIELVAIVPTAFLIARAVADWRALAESFRLLICDADRCDHLVLDDDRVVDWKHCADAGEWTRHHTVTADEEPAANTWVIVGRDQWDVPVDGPVQWCPLSPKQLLARGTTSVLAGHWTRGVNLRRGGLAANDPLLAVAGPLRHLAVAAVAGCLLVIAACWYRDRRIAERSEHVIDQQRGAYQEVFPERRVPVLLIRSVGDEYRRVLGSRGRGDAIELPKPATAVLRDLFVGLEQAKSAGARFRLLELSIEDGDCSLTVRARDSVQIGAIAKSLEQSGFRVGPPAAQQIEPGRDEPIVTFQSTITAEWSTGGRPAAAATPGDAS